MIVIGKIFFFNLIDESNKEINRKILNQLYKMMIVLTLISTREKWIIYTDYGKWRIYSKHFFCIIFLSRKFIFQLFTMRFYFLKEKRRKLVLIVFTIFHSLNLILLNSSSNQIDKLISLTIRYIFLIIFTSLGK